MTQTILYIYSFPSYLVDCPRVKIGRTSGADDSLPKDLADARIKGQGTTAHPEQYVLLLSVSVPGNCVESTIHSQLKENNYQVQVQESGAGREWFQFPSHEAFNKFRDSIYRAVLLGDYSELGGGRRDITGDDYNAIREAFGVVSMSGKDFNKEKVLIKSVSDGLSPFYPSFDNWLLRTIQDPKTVFNVALRDNRSVGVTIWKPKPNNTAKLATLYVDEEFRDSGIGRNLVLSCFEQWRQQNITRAFVTTSRTYLIPFFERYGFMVEGFSRNAYDRPNGEQSPEWYLSKLMLSDQSLIEQSKCLYPLLVSSSTFPAGRPAVETTIKEDGKVHLMDKDGKTIDRVRLNRWFHMAYPCESELTPDDVIIIPIYPRFLIEMFQNGKTVYYGSPSFTNKDVTGCRIIFYATDPIKGIVAIARVVKRLLGTPSELYEQLGGRGVFSLEQIGEPDTRKQAILFDGLMPLTSSIERQQAINLGIFKGHPQSSYTLPMESFNRVMAQGGVYVP